MYRLPGLRGEEVWAKGLRVRLHSADHLRIEISLLHSLHAALPRRAKGLFAFAERLCACASVPGASGDEDATRRPSGGTAVLCPLKSGVSDRLFQLSLFPDFFDIFAAARHVVP